MAKQKKLSDRINDLRMSQGMNQVQFAEALGVSQSRISEWELGQTEPSTEGFVRLAMQAAKSDPSESLFFWNQAGLAPEALLAAANEVLKKGEAKMDAILGTAEGILKARVRDKKEEADKGNVFIVPPYEEAQCLPFEVEVPASLVSNRSSTYYLAAPSDPYKSVGCFVAPGDILVFDSCEASRKSYRDFIGEKVLFEFEDGLFVGRLGYLERSMLSYLVLGPADEIPSNWEFGITPHLRVIHSPVGAHLVKDPQGHRREHKVRRFLGVCVAHFSGGVQPFWKSRALAGAPKEK